MQISLPNPKFLDEVVSQINQARKSIIVVNYLAVLIGDKCVKNDTPGEPKGTHRRVYCDPISKVVSALIRAHKRGVKISVFLEGSKLEENFSFYKVLKDVGIDVWMDTSQTFIHHKTILFDNKRLIVGSHNLTAGSIFRSREYSVLLDNKKVITDFKKELKFISEQRNIIKKNKCNEFVNMPLEILLRPVSVLFKAHADIVFDLYMYMLGSGCLVENLNDPDCESLCKASGFHKQKKKFKTHLCTRFINRLIKRLNELEIAKYHKNSKAHILIPKTFWKHGWHKKLSFRATYFYLISINETKDSPFHPWWRKSMRQLVKKYRTDQSAIKQAIAELEKKGIIEVVRSKPVKRGNRYSQEAYYYRHNPL